jgi:uncharacterized protein YbjT (DUF2867 family)
MILVTGATGKVGAQVVAQLAAAGAPVRALARDPEKAAWLNRPGVEVARGDLLDPDSLRAAMVGVRKVFLLCPVDPAQVELEANAVDAALAAHVEHLVKLSALNASHESSAALLHWHFETEQRIRRERLPYTILRPNMFMQEVLRHAPAIRAEGAFSLPLGRARLSLVDIRDIAEVAARVLTEGGHHGRVYELTGPEALGFDEVAAAIAAATGRPVRYVPIAPDQFRAGFLGSGAPRWLADLVCDLFETFPGQNDRLGDGVARVTGRPPRSFAQFARDHAAEFGAA